MPSERNRKVSYNTGQGSPPAQIMNVHPVTLEGRHVRLEPLSQAHVAGLCEFSFDPDLWKVTVERITNAQEMSGYVQRALDAQAAGTALPFATMEQASGRVIGCTRYMNIDARNRRVEIGSTWIGRPWHRTIVNTEAKYLMLRHAFETLGCVRVELKTDALNTRSRNAIQIGRAHV